MMMGGGWLIGLFVLLLFLLLVAGLVAAGVWLLTQGLGAKLNAGGPRAPVRDDDEVFEILRRRYAQGEITQEEYERMREDLRR